MRPWIPAAALLLALSPLAVVHPMTIQGRSMEPCLSPGRLVWVLRAWAAGPPRRGEVWVVQGPEGPAVKRVIALPGQRLERREGHFELDGLPDPTPVVSQAGHGGPWEAGSGFLVLGDNRPVSRDSRAWGPLPREAFRGRLIPCPSPIQTPRPSEKPGHPGGDSNAVPN